jgi:hypothetical protein
MRLENLYENFGTATPERQAEFMSEFRLRRAEELSNPATTSKRRMTTSSVNRSKIDLSVTPEEKALMKLLGLKQKDIAALRAIEPDEEESGVELFSDQTFAEDEDE